MSHAIANARTMLRRQYKHDLRYPAGTVSALIMPLVFLLLFTYVFGGQMGMGLPSGAGYIDYIVPGIVFMCISGGVSQAALGAAMDMTEGIIARFRTMPISRGAVLTAHAVANVIRGLGAVTIIIGVSLLMGFEPDAGFLDWIAFVGVVALYALMISWLGVAFGLSARNVEGANAKTLPLVFLPFVSSAFVPAESTAAGVQWFIEYQPFTAMIETIRGLLLGAPIGSNLIVSVLWAVGFTLIGYVWALKLYHRDR
ncbi:ABC transporter permease [Kibdelosporangium aridum]|uniref:Transport permease protein n=1 Tax=Kibdelosporangium aridum TaxID=2030 RepID=A0A1W2EYN7_KIBAR|nr:ABC transporter permease [Kibdelosporangium aridum]SMD14823.1 ABC-2 type transport system permease protein [Kibdelosporangium aridum]